MTSSDVCKTFAMRLYMELLGTLSMVNVMGLGEGRRTSMSWFVRILQWFGTTRYDSVMGYIHIWNVCARTVVVLKTRTRKNRVRDWLPCSSCVGMTWTSVADRKHARRRGGAFGLPPTWSHGSTYICGTHCSIAVVRRVLPEYFNHGRQGFECGSWSQWHCNVNRQLFHACMFSTCLCYRYSSGTLDRDLAARRTKEASNSAKEKQLGFGLEFA